VGAGHAGGRCALLLRQKGFEGRILLIGEEPNLPYERPPLSKGLLTGSSEFENCLLATREHYRDQSIELVLSNSVVNIDRAGARAVLKSGDKYGYSKLVIATGGHCRELHCPGNQLGNIFVLRSIEHSRSIAENLKPGANVVVIGGGFIGLETAASAVANGCAVTIVESADRLLGRVFPESISSDIAGIHENRGVEIILNDSVEIFDGDDSVKAVCLGSGKRVPADVVIVGIGIIPETKLAETAGLEIDDGIKANQFCQTSDPAIYVIGDSARGFNQHYQRWMRLESWQNAEQQAEIAASHISGFSDGWRSVPWFWSDQYQYNIQIAGTFQDTEEVVVRGGLMQGKVIYFGLNTGRVTGAVAIGEGTSATRDLRVSQMLIDQEVKVLKGDLIDPAIKLKSLLQGGQGQ